MWVGESHGQLGVTPQDALMEFVQHSPWFCALLIDKAAAGIPIEAECVTRPAAPVQGRHLVSDERLVQRVLSQQVAKLTDQVGMPAKLQLTLDALQDGRPALLFEAVTHPRHPVAADPGQRLAAPQAVRLAQQHGRLVIVAARDEGIRLPAQPAELMQVDCLRIDIEHVASGAPRQQDAIANGLPERRSKPGDVDRETLAGLGRRPRIPQPVNDRLGSSTTCGQARSWYSKGACRNPPLALIPVMALLTRTLGETNGSEEVITLRRSADNAIFTAGFTMPPHPSA